MGVDVGLGLMIGIDQVVVGHEDVDQSVAVVVGGRQRLPFARSAQGRGAGDVAQKIALVPEQPQPLGLQADHEIERAVGIEVDEEPAVATLPQSVDVEPPRRRGVIEVAVAPVGVKACRRMQPGQEQVDVAVSVEVRQYGSAVRVDLGAGLVEARRQDLGGHVVEDRSRRDRRPPGLRAHTGEAPGVACLAQIQHQIEAVLAHAPVVQSPEDPDRLLGLDSGLAGGTRPQLHLPGVHLGGQDLGKLGEVLVPALAKGRSVEIRGWRDPVGQHDARFDPPPRVLAMREPLAPKVGKKRVGAVVGERALLERAQDHLLRAARLAAVGLGRPELLGQRLARRNLGARARRRQQNRREPRRRAA